MNDVHTPPHAAEDGRRGRSDNRALIAEGFDARELDLRDLRAMLFRNRWLVAGVVGLCLIAGIALALLTVPTYRSTATVQIEDQAPQVLATENADVNPPTGDPTRYLQTQVEIIQSRSLADRVARSLNLYRQPTLFEAMGREPPEAAPGSVPWQRQAQAILMGNLTVEQEGTTRLVQVSFDSPNATFAATVANQFAKDFIAGTLQRRFDTSAYSRNFLQQQLTETRRRLEVSERALIAYARQAGLTGLTAGGGDTSAPTSLVASNLVRLNSDYAAARAARIAAQEKWLQAQGASALNVAEVQQSSTVQQLLARRAELEVQYEGERERRRDEYPTVRQLRAQIEEVDAQIGAASSRIKNSLREQYELAARQEQELANSVTALQGDTLNEQSRGVQLNILRRDADTNRALYEALLQRYRELNAASGITANNISIIDDAERSGVPIWPKPLLNAVVGGLGGLALALLLVFARERLNDSIRSPDDVEARLGLPLLGILPMSSGDVSAHEELLDPHSSLSEAIYALRTSLELSTREGMPKTLLVTSTRPAEGKSTLSYALAAECAQSGGKVLLLDADMRRPSVHHMFDIGNDVGLSNVLAGSSALSQAIQKTSVADLDVVTSGPVPPSPPRLLSGPALDATLASAAQLYDIVIIDAPPVLGLADALQLSAAVTGTLFVVEAQSGAQGQTKAAIKRLAGADARLLGVVLTKFDFRRVGYSDYADSGYYHYGEGREEAKE